MASGSITPNEERQQGNRVVSGEQSLSSTLANHFDSCDRDCCLPSSWKENQAQQVTTAVAHCSDSKSINCPCKSKIVENQEKHLLALSSETTKEISLSSCKVSSQNRNTFSLEPHVDRQQDNPMEECLNFGKPEIDEMSNHNVYTKLTEKTQDCENSGHNITLSSKEQKIDIIPDSLKEWQCAPHHSNNGKAAPTFQVPDLMKPVNRLLPHFVLLSPAGDEPLYYQWPPIKTVFS